MDISLFVLVFGVGMFFVSGVILFLDSRDELFGVAVLFSVMGLAFAVVGAHLVMTERKTVASAEEAIAYAKDRSGEVIDLDVATAAHLGGPTVVTHRVMRELLPDGGPRCRIVSAVKACRDDHSGRLVLHFDPAATLDDGVERITTQKALITAAADGAGYLEVPVSGGGVLPADAKAAVTDTALTEIYGDDWRRAPTCQSVENILICRRDDDSMLVVMSDGSGTATSVEP